MTSRPRPNRRRFLSITAAVAGLSLLPRRSAPAPAAFETWQGTALGARASIRLAHPDRGFARALIGRARAEIERLEQVFSLYRPDSALSRLNRRGVLPAPPLDLVRLLAEARRYSELTDGAFDITVQPLWRLYAEHFGGDGAKASGPDPGALAAVLARIDYRAVSVDPARIAFERPDMAITLNGIAQGYITDRVADLFRRAGLDTALIDLGELRALGRHPEGRAWSIGLEDPRQRARIFETLELGNGALATSAGHGTRFDAAGDHHHLFEPSTGQSTRRYLSLSVKAPTATEADALSTGLYHLDPDRLAALVGRRHGVSALAMLANGELREWRQWA
jgi:thiamine biosynthesis lipoprotein